MNFSFLKRVVLPYLVYICLFIGTGFLSGAVVHYPLNPPFFLLIGVIGATIFTLGSTVQEAVYNKKNLREEGVVKFIIFSILLSIGIGMISGGIQHFSEFPLYASRLIPLGIGLSFVTFIVKNNLKISGKQMSMMVLFGVVILVPFWFALSTYAASMKVVPHGHDEEEEAPATHVQSAILDEKIFVALEGEGKIAVLDPLSQKRTSTIDLSHDGTIFSPHNVQSAPDGKTLWVTANVMDMKMEHTSFRFLPTAMANENHGNMGAQDEVIVIDPNTEKILERIPLGTELHLAHVVLTPDNKKALITAQTEGSIYIYDAQTYQLIKKISTHTGDEPHGLRVTPDGKEAYIATLKGNSVGILNLTTLNLAYHELRGAGVQTAVTQDRATIFISLYDTKQIAFFDREKNNWGVIPLPEGAKGPIQIYPTMDSKYLYVADQGYYFGQPQGNNVFVLNTATKKVEKTIPVGAAPHGIVIAPDDQKIYVSNIVSNDVSIIDRTSQSEVIRVPVGKEPNGITYWKKS